MDRIEFGDGVISFIKKYRFVILVLAIGILLMLLPEGKISVHNDSIAEPTSVSEESQEEKLARILSEVQGAGKVMVMLTYASGQETIYQTDTDISQNGESSSERSDTVTLTDSQRNQTGLIQRVDPPVYLGAVVVCQGADDPTVKLAMVEAVSNATGLSWDKISVLKME